MVLCRACGQRHDPLLRCERVAPVVHADVVHADVVHKPVAKRKPGRYIDADARRAYRRAWMARRRAGPDNGHDMDIRVLSPVKSIA